MLPRELKSETFRAYPPEARKLAVENVPAFRRLPLSFLPSLLRELIEYDYKFPAERAALTAELASLGSLSNSEADDVFHGFSEIKLSPQLEGSDWVNSPAQFVEQLSAHLWTTHQLDAFRIAATKYGDHLSALVRPEPPPIPRLGISVIGQGVASFEDLCFASSVLMEHFSAESSRRMVLVSCWKQSRLAPRTTPFRTVTGTSMAGNRPVTTQSSPVFLTVLLSRPVRPCSPEFIPKLNVLEWAPSGCAASWLNCDLPISAGKQLMMKCCSASNLNC
jgi:hypothetical protein